MRIFAVTEENQLTGTAGKNRLFAPNSSQNGQGCKDCLGNSNVILRTHRPSIQDEFCGLLSLWQATCDGSQNPVPKVWGRKFPCQVRVKLVIPKVADMPKSVLKKLGIDAAIGRFDNCVDEDTAEDLVGSLLGAAS